MSGYCKSYCITVLDSFFRIKFKLPILETTLLLLSLNTYLKIHKWNAMESVFDQREYMYAACPRKGQLSELK